MLPRFQLAQNNFDDHHRTRVGKDQVERKPTDGNDRHITAIFSTKKPRRHCASK